jgi:hypothetical protein
MPSFPPPLSSFLTDTSPSRIPILCYYAVIPASPFVPSRIFPTSRLTTFPPFVFLTVSSPLFRHSLLPLVLFRSLACK